MRRIYLLFLSILLILQACNFPTNVTPIPMGTVDLPLPALRTPEPSATPANPIPADPAIMRGLTVTLWHGWDGESSTLIDQMVSEFNLTNPYGFKVVAISMGNFAKLAEAVKLGSEGSDLPQMVIALPEQIGANSGLFIDLSQYMASKDYGLTGVEIPGVFLAQSNQRGSQLGMPMTRSARFLFYNHTFASELGFQQAPATLVEFEKQVCAANQSWKMDEDLTNDGYGGYALDTISNWQTPLSWFHSNDPDFGKNIPLVFDTTQNTKTLSFFNNLRTSGCSWFPEAEDNYGNLASRRALITTGDLLELGIQADAFTQKNSTDDWQVIPFPGQTPVIIAYGADFAILEEDIPHQLASWVFLRWMMQSENQMRWAENTGLFPVTLAALNLAGSSTSLPKQYHRSVDLIKTSVEYPTGEDWPVARDLLADGFYQFNKMYPYVTPSEYLLGIDTQSTELLDLK